MDTVPHRIPKASSRNSKENIDQRKLDKQLTGQASTSPFMTIREGASRRVSFDTRDKCGDKIDKLTVMLGRLAANTVRIREHLSLKYIKAEEEDKTEVIVRETIRIGTG